MLRRQALRDTQELLVLFTPQGRLDCVSRVSAKRSGLIEPLTVIRAHLRLGRSLPVLQEVTLDRTFAGLLGDFDRLRQAGYLLHLWLEAFPGEGDSVDPYRLLRLSLDSLDAGLDARALLTWTELQVMRLLGGAVCLRACVGCGGAPGEWFSLEGALCSSCYRADRRRVSGEVLGWLAFLQRARLLMLAEARPSEEVLVAGRELMTVLVMEAFPRLSRFLVGGVLANSGD